MSPASKKKNSAGPAVHFIGIGGIGASSLAQWFLANGWQVSGSDVSESVVLDDLRKLGIRIAKLGNRAGNIHRRVTLVVYTQAVDDRNPEFREARRRKLTLRSYPEELGRLTQLHERTVAVAGAHGKSTTTGLLATILTEAKFDPTVVIGTRLPAFGNRNFRQGKGDYLVLEADEYKRSFLHYFPYALIITNIDREHLDVYKKGLPEIKETFLKFIANARPEGKVLLNRDDRNLSSIGARAEKICRAKNIRVLWYSLTEPLAEKVRKATPLLGRHNLSNALAAVRMALELGVPEAAALKALKGYKGAWRRLEPRGQYKGARVYDDYGHHPTEIKATLTALKENFAKKRVICIFQPHQAERLADLFGEFQSAFDAADATLLLPLYHVAGRDARVPKDSEALARAMQKKHPQRLVFYVPRTGDLKKALDVFRPDKNTIIVMMGAGDIVNLTAGLVGA